MAVRSCTAAVLRGYSRQKHSWPGRHEALGLLLAAFWFAGILQVTNAGESFSRLIAAAPFR